MNRIFHLLIGPELLWCFFYLVALFMVRITASPVKSMDNFWISTIYIIPLILIPLSFLLYYVPGVTRDWMLLRIWIAGIIGGHLVMSRSLLAHTEQGPGAGMAYMLGMGILFVALGVGSIWAKIKF